MSTQLTGMPELKLGLNDQLMYDQQNKASAKGIEL